MRASSQTTSTVLAFVTLLFVLGIKANTPRAPSEFLAIKKSQWYVLPERASAPGLQWDVACEVERIRERLSPIHPFCDQESQAKTLQHGSVFSSNNFEALPRFVYRLDITNVGERPITSVTWEYLFFDTGSNAQVERHRFVSQLNLRPGHSTELEETSLRPPTRVVDVSSLNSIPGKAMREVARIISIEFAESK